MRIIKIEAYENGGHDNNSAAFDYEAIPEGWAVIPEDMELQNFPFGEVTAEEADGVMVVTGWTPGKVPGAAEMPITEVEQLRADVDFIAVMTGVEL